MRKTRHLGYGLAVVAFFAAFLLRYALDKALPPGLPFVTFFPAVLLTAFVAGLGPGLLVALASGISAWFFFLPVERSFVLQADPLTRMPVEVTDLLTTSGATEAVEQFVSGV